jgi:hypothetical protein
MSAPEQRAIDWSSAEIDDARLTVALTGKGSKAFKERFEGVVSLLDTAHGRWGEIHVTKGGIEVDAVEPGAESELRHFLESVVLEVNSELPPGEDDGRNGASLEVDEAAQADRQMAAAFRAFADD